MNKYHPMKQDGQLSKFFTYKWNNFTFAIAASIASVRFAGLKHSTSHISAVSVLFEKNLHIFTSANLLGNAFNNLSVCCTLLVY